MNSPTCSRSSPARTALVANLLLAGVVQGCSMQQVYGAGQAWQRQECNRINDTEQRSRCMASSSTSYDEYKRQVEDAKAGK